MSYLEVKSKFRTYSFEREKKDQASFSETSDTPITKNSHHAPANPNADDEEPVPLDHNNPLKTLKEMRTISKILELSPNRRSSDWNQ